ncbi:protein PAXX isoform 1-T1 [Hipposideros larvatus]
MLTGQNSLFDSLPKGAFIREKRKSHHSSERTCPRSHPCAKRRIKELAQQGLTIAGIPPPEVTTKFKQEVRTRELTTGPALPIVLPALWSVILRCRFTVIRLEGASPRAPGLKPGLRCAAHCGERGPSSRSGHPGSPAPRAKLRSPRHGSHPIIKLRPRTKHRPDSPALSDAGPTPHPRPNPPGSAGPARDGRFPGRAAALSPAPWRPSFALLRPRSAPRCRPRPRFRPPPAGAGVPSQSPSSLRCHGAEAAAAVAASLHAAAGPRARALCVLLRGGGDWGQGPRRLQSLCDRRRGTLEHLLHAGQPGGPPAEGTAASPRKNPRLAEPQQFLPGKDLGWGCACCSVTQFPQNKTQAPEIGSYVERGCSPGILLDSGAPPSCFPQTQILREAALDLGSEGGVRESPSSTLASRVRNQPVV